VTCIVTLAGIISEADAAVSQKESSMANESKDQPVLGHIDGPVKEEERLYAKGELTVTTVTA
jgi:hypothetical protein